VFSEFASNPVNLAVLGAGVIIVVAIFLTVRG